MPAKFESTGLALSTVSSPHSNLALFVTQEARGLVNSPCVSEDRRELSELKCSESRKRIEQFCARWN